MVEEDKKNEKEKNDEEQERVKPERMDHLEKGADIGKSRKKKTTEEDN